MSKIIDNIEAMLKARMDQNDDHKLDAKDLAIVAKRVRAQVLEETVKFPTFMLIIMFVGGLIVGFFAGKIL